MRTWSDFFSMGGYAFYVWGSYLISLIAIGGEVLLLRRRKKESIEHMNRASRKSGAGGS